MALDKAGKECGILFYFAPETLILRSDKDEKDIQEEKETELLF